MKQQKQNDSFLVSIKIFFYSVFAFICIHCAIFSSVNGQTQMLQWACPPNFHNWSIGGGFNTSNTMPGIIPSPCINSVSQLDNNNNLLFFLVSSNNGPSLTLYNASGVAVTSFNLVSIYSANIRDEIAIVPRDASNKEFYVFFSLEGAVGGSVNRGALCYGIINCCGSPIISEQTQILDAFVGTVGAFAVSPKTGTDRSLYWINEEDGIQKFTITPTSIINQITIANVSTLNLTNLEIYTNELELSPDQQYLAWGAAQYNPKVFIFNLNTNILTSSLLFSGGGEVAGVEFNSTSNTLYASARHPGGLYSGLYQITLTGSPTFIAGSALFYDTQLELARDGLVYGIDYTGNNIGAINTFGNLVTTSLSGPFTSSAYNGGPSHFRLPDQIDGENYDNSSFPATLTANIIQTPDVPLCNNNVLHPTLTASVNQTVTYQWSTWSVPTTQSILAYNTGIYTVTVTDVCNVTATATIEVYKCCGTNAFEEPPSSIIWRLDGTYTVSDMLTTLPSYPYLSGSTTAATFNNSFNCSTTSPNGILALNGTLIIDVPTTFHNFELLCGPNSEIIVTGNGTLSFDNCVYLHTCNDYMWKGITVDNNNAPLQLDIYGNNIWIEDAKVGITINNNAAFKISNTIFNKNWKGVVINGGDYSSIPGQFYNNTFQCNDLISNATVPCLAPHSGKRTTSGIVLIDVVNIQIGDANFPVNTFTNHDNGIYCLNSNALVVNNLFTNLNFSFANNTSGFGIVSRGTSITPNVTIGGAGAAMNNFNNCDYGIFSSGTNTIVDNSHFLSNSHGIFSINRGTLNTSNSTFTNGYYDIECAFNVSDIIINNNQFTGAKTGIFLHNNALSNISITNNSFTDLSSFGVYSSLNLQSNQLISLNRIYNNIGSTSLTGIYVAEASPDPLSFYHIEYNEIYNSPKGIVCMMLEHPNIYRNNPISVLPVNISTFPTYGIAVFRCNEAQIIENNVNGDVANIPYWWSRGISLDNSPSANVLCNQSGNIGLGFFVSGTTNGTFAGNVMGDCFHQFFLNYCSNGLGDQGYAISAGYPFDFPFDNEWQGVPLTISGGYRTYAYGYSNTSGFTTFHTRVGLPFEPLSTDHGFEFTTSIPCQTNVLINYTEPTTYCNIPQRPENDNEQMDMRIAGDSITYSAGLGSFKWLSKQYLYEKLRNNDSLLYSDALYQQQHDSIALTNIGEITNIRDSISYLPYDSIDQQELNDLIALTNSMSPTHVIESYYKTVDKILLKNINKEYPTYTTPQLASLRLIASKCPYQYGPAVYAAQTLLVFVDSSFNYADNCESYDPNNLRIGRASANKLYNAIVSPNPSNGRLSIISLSSVDTEQSLRFFDYLGREIKVKYISYQDRTFEITGGLETQGIYTCCIYSSNELVGKVKITIIK